MTSTEQVRCERPTCDAADHPSKANSLGARMNQISIPLPRFVVIIQPGRPPDRHLSLNADLLQRSAAGPLLLASPLFPSALLSRVAPSRTLSVDIIVLDDRDTRALVPEATGASPLLNEHSKSIMIYIE